MLGRAGFLLATACAAGDLTLPADGAPAALTIVSGDRQLGPAGSPLQQPLRVRVADSRSRPVQGAVIAFAFVGQVPDAAIAPDTAATGGDGVASAAARLGSASGEQLVMAQIAGSRTDALRAVFRITAMARPEPLPPAPPPPSPGGGTNTTPSGPAPGDSSGNPSTPGASTPGGAPSASPPNPPQQPPQPAPKKPQPPAPQPQPEPKKPQPQAPHPEPKKPQPQAPQPGHDPVHPAEPGDGHDAHDG
jgi:hypothetical protein